MFAKIEKITSLITFALNYSHHFIFSYNLKLMLSFIFISSTSFVFTFMLSVLQFIFSRNLTDPFIFPLCQQIFHFFAFNVECFICETVIRLYNYYTQSAQQSVIREEHVMQTRYFIVFIGFNCTQLQTGTFSRLAPRLDAFYRNTFLRNCIDRYSFCKFFNQLIMFFFLNHLRMFFFLVQLISFNVS